MARRRVAPDGTAAVAPMSIEPTQAQVAHVAAQRRVAEAERWKPDRVTLLLVAETPPTALDRYFYFDDVEAHDSLFRHVVEGVLGERPSRAGKAEHLRALRDHGVFLIDIKPDPFDTTALEAFVPDLVERCRELAPRGIILIKTTVYDAAFAQLRLAGLPVANTRLPFPGSGRQREFRDGFGAALADCADSRPSPDAQPAPGPDAGRVTLHREIQRILRAHGGPMSTSDIAAEVNAAGRYRKRDGTPITRFQVHGRTRNYRHLFQRDGDLVLLASRRKERRGGGCVACSSRRSLRCVRAAPPSTASPLQSQTFVSSRCRWPGRPRPAHASRQLPLRAAAAVRRCRRSGYEGCSHGHAARRPCRRAVRARRAGSVCAREPS